jgi:hypothetical protein
MYYNYLQLETCHSFYNRKLINCANLKILIQHIKWYVYVKYTYKDICVHIKGFIVTNQHTKLRILIKYM